MNDMTWVPRAREFWGSPRYSRFAVWVLIPLFTLAVREILPLVQGLAR